jgi:archaellum component FlaC
VGHVRESNQQLDSELVEIEKQIEELKRISRAQVSSSVFFSKNS